VQARGVLDALPLAYEFKRVAPSGLWHALSPWRPVNPTERFGTAQSQFYPPWPDFAVSIGRLTMALVREATARRLLWDRSGSSPYPAFLAHADAFLAPADAVNMTGEPSATGKPVYVFTPAGGSPKFVRFHEAH
jgi:mitochondrial fission protein ELM1